MRPKLSKYVPWATSIEPAGVSVTNQIAFDPDHMTQHISGWGLGTSFQRGYFVLFCFVCPFGTQILGAIGLAVYLNERKMNVTFIFIILTPTVYMVNQIQLKLFFWHSAGCRHFTDHEFSKMSLNMSFSPCLPLSLVMLFHLFGATAQL